MFVCDNGGKKDRPKRFVRTFCLICFGYFQVITNGYHSFGHNLSNQQQHCRIQINYRHLVTLQYCYRKHKESNFKLHDWPNLLEGNLRRQGAVSTPFQFGTQNITRRLCHLKSAAQNKNTMCTNSRVNNRDRYTHASNDWYWYVTCCLIICK